MAWASGCVFCVLSLSVPGCQQWLMTQHPGRSTDGGLRCGVRPPACVAALGGMLCLTGGLRSTLPECGGLRGCCL